MTGSAAITGMTLQVGGAPLIACPEAIAYAAALGVAGEQEIRAHRPVDQITVLQCAMGCRATKRVSMAGISDYACGRWFATTTAPAAGIAEAARVLGELEREPRLFIIRAMLIAGRHPGRVRRLLYPDPKTKDQPYFEACPRRWAGLDFDALTLPEGVDPVDLEAVAAVAIARLPEPFRRASCWAQLTSGAGIKPGGRVRLFYWLERATTGAELKRWLRGVPGLDTSTLNDVTPNFVAAPIFAAVADPVPVRSRLIAGEVDSVVVQIPPEPQRRAATKRHDHGPRSTNGRPTGQYVAMVVEGVRTAPPGQGRAALMSAAMRLFGAAKAGRLDPAQAAALLKAAMIDRGWDADDAKRGMTIADINRQLQWCWDHAQ